MEDGFKPRTKMYIKNQNCFTYIQMSLGVMFSNASPSFYVHYRWTEIAMFIKLCKKCPLHIILPTHN